MSKSYEMTGFEQDGNERLAVDGVAVTSHIGESGLRLVGNGKVEGRPSQPPSSESVASSAGGSTAPTKPIRSMIWTNKGVIFPDQVCPETRRSLGIAPEGLRSVQPQRNNNND